MATRLPEPAPVAMISGNTPKMKVKAVINTALTRSLVATMADKLMEALKKNGHKATIEGQEKADWVLIDALDVIVHLFRPEVREFYNIEKMWQAIADKRK